MKKIIVLFIVLSGFQYVALSQKLHTHVQYEFIADNREYFSPFGFPQTIMGSQAAFEAGFTIDSLERIMFGINYLYIFGAPIFEKPFVPTLYYSYAQNKEHTKPHITLYLGSFPRQTFFPFAMYTDSLYYFRPNTQGLNVYVKKTDFLIKQLSFSQNFVFDWMTLENYGAKEEFLVGVSGKLQYKHFFITDNFYYQHRAEDNINAGKDIIDNGTYSVMLGKKFYSRNKINSNETMLEPMLRAKLEVGNLFTWQKIRPQNTEYSQGLLGSFAFYFTKKIDLTTTYYIGDKTHLILGDPLYKSGNYLRLDASYTFKNTNRVYTYFTYSLHCIQGEINHSQKLYLRVTI